MILLDEPGVLRIFYEEKSGIQVHEWLDYNPENRDRLILELLEQIYQLLIEYPVEKVLVKTDHTRGVFSPEIQKFIQDVQFPRFLTDTSLHFVATVTPTNQLAKSGTKLWEVQLRQNSSIAMYDAESEAKAREWLDQVG